MADGKTRVQNKAYKLAWWREYTAANPEKVRAYNKSYYDTHKAAISAWGKAYRATRKQELEAKEKAWRLANRERLAARRRARYAAHRQEEIAQAAAYRQQNRERWRNWHAEYTQKNKEAIAQRNAQWAKTNREHLALYRRQNAGAFNARTARRRAALLNATPIWADLDAIQRVYESAVRLTRSTGIKHEVDHIYPLCGKTVCGLHVPENLQILPKIQNASKGNRVRPPTIQLQCPSDAEQMTD